MYPYGALYCSHVSHAHKQYATHVYIKGSFTQTRVKGTCKTVHTMHAAVEIATNSVDLCLLLRQAGPGET